MKPRMVLGDIIEAVYRTSGLKRPDVPGTLLDPLKIKADPRRFQFKETTSEEGTTDVLSEVDHWDPIKADRVVVWEDKAGEFFIVDGHHRLQLAKRLQRQTGKPKEIEAFLIREADGIDAKQARALGAMRNLAAGRGTAQDAAKFMRDSGISAGELKKQGVSLKEGVVSQAVHLSALVPSVWDQVVTGKLTDGEGVAIGKGLPGDDLRQRSAAKALAGRRLSAPELREAVALIAQTPETVEGGSLFGNITRLLMAERGRVMSAAKRELKRDRSTFATLNKRIGRIEDAGNRLDKDANKREAQAAREQLDTLERLAGKVGPVARALSEAAQLVATRKGSSAAVKEGARAVLAAVATLSDTELANATRMNRRGGKVATKKNPSKKAARPKKAKNKKPSKAARSKAARKAARTRAKNAAAKKAAAAKAAQTRAKNKRAKSARGKKGGQARAAKAKAKTKAARELVSAKIARERRAGRPRAQAAAIALKTARTAGLTTNPRAPHASKIGRTMFARLVRELEQRLKSATTGCAKSARAAANRAINVYREKPTDANHRAAELEIARASDACRKNPERLKTAPPLSEAAQAWLSRALNRPGKSRGVIPRYLGREEGVSQADSDKRQRDLATATKELEQKKLAKWGRDPVAGGLALLVTKAGEVWPNVLKAKPKKPRIPTQAQGLLFDLPQPVRQRELFELNPSERPKRLAPASKDQLRLAATFGVNPGRAERVKFWNPHGTGSACIGRITNVVYVATRHGRAAKWSHDLEKPMYAATTAAGRDKLAKLHGSFEKARSAAANQGSLAAKWVQLGPVFSVRVKAPGASKSVTLTFPESRRPLLLVDDGNRRLVITYTGEPSRGVPIFGHAVSSDARAVSSRGVLV